MKINRLAVALSLSLLTLTSANAAKYTVTEIPMTDLGVNVFAGAINESGEMLMTASTPLNPPIDIELIDFDDDFLTFVLEDINGAQVGNISTDDLVILFNYVKVRDDTLFSQQLSDTQAYVFDNSDVQLVRGFDQIQTDLDGFSRSSDTIAYGINNGSAIVGTSTAPFYKIYYRSEAGNEIIYVVNDFTTRGFLEIDNQVFPILAPDITLGGISEAFDINNSYEVAGYATTEVVEAFEDAVDDCEDSELRGDVPVEACLQLLLRNGTNNAFKRRAMIWEYDPQGNLIRERELGLLFEPEPTDTRLFSSRAVAINDNGIAVGISSDYYLDNVNNVRDFAAIFDGDDVVPITNDDEYFTSFATDINNDDFVVGYAFAVIQGTTRSKFFVHDFRGESTVFPDDFFDTSSSVARAINDNGLVVGDGEVDADLIGTRRREAFLYDIEEDDFQNINDMLSCDSPYTIAQARDINGNDEISATATIYRERRNIAGEIDLDDQGNIIREGMTVAVKLTPIIGGEIDDCQLVPVTLERKGGAPSALVLLLLTPVLFLRRFKKYL
jgi:uncharacterized membrane protein